MSDAERESQFRYMREAAREIFSHALAEASIAKGFARHVHCERGVLRVCEHLYDLQSYSRVLVISIGKAGHTMAEALDAANRLVVAGGDCRELGRSFGTGPRLSLFSRWTSDAECRIHPRRESHSENAGGANCRRRW